METKELKKIDIHQDYVLFQLFSLLRQQLGVVCSYMQKTTPYGEEYKKAFEKHKEISEALKELEDLLQDCVEARKKNVE